MFEHLLDITNLALRGDWIIPIKQSYTLIDESFSVVKIVSLHLFFQHTRILMLLYALFNA